VSVGRLNGETAARLRVQVPAWGAWWADVDLVSPVELDVGASASLDVADVALTGTVVSGGVAYNRAAYRVVGGAGGWGRVVAAAPYRDDGGVKVATVLSDAAAAAGETLAGVPTTRVGPHYARSNAVASRVLNELAPRGWYVDFDGVTQIGQRAETVYDSDATRVRVDRRVGVVELATQTLDGLVPGVIVDDLAPATDVEYELDAKRLTVRVYAGARSTRRLDAYARIVDAIDPRRHYRGTFAFRVVQQSGERLALQPVRAASGLPDLDGVPVRLAPGVRAEHALGSLVLVTFVDADPSRPVVVAGDAAGSPGWAPTQLELQGDSDALALASKVESELSAIASAWANHTHSYQAPTGGSTPAVSGPGGGYSPGSVGSTLVKAD